jgi:hypothetical protein
MNSESVYNQIINMKKDKKVQGLSQGSTFASGKISAVKAFCMLFVLFIAGSAHAQTSVSRTSSVIVGASSGTSSFQDSLWTINQADYTVATRLQPTLAGFSISGITGMATNPMSGTVYAIVRLTGPSSRKLVTIDPNTAVCTLIGDLGAKFASLAFNANGTLYGVTGQGAAPANTLYTINTANANTTFVATLAPIGDGQGQILCFNPDDNKFYHWSGNGTVGWERFDTAYTTIETLSYTGFPGGETFGSVYVGGGNFIMSNISGYLYNWDTAGNIGANLGFMPDDLRGLLHRTTTSTISTSVATAICTGNAITLTVTGGVGNYQWYMDGTAITGETNATYTTTAAGHYNCVYTDNLNITDSTTPGIIVTLLPLPAFAAATTTVCSGNTYNYAQTTTGIASSSWGRAFVTGITPTTGGGTGNISEVLTSASYLQVPVVYADTLVGTNGCRNTTSFTVTVNPTPVLYPSPLEGSICSGVTFTANDTSRTPTTTYSWSRAAFPGSPVTMGTGSLISETLTNPTTAPVEVLYFDTLRAYGCMHYDTVKVIVNPTPVLTSTLIPHSICDSSLFKYLDTTMTTIVDSVRWSRSFNSNIANIPATGADGINEFLDNISDNSVPVTYAYTIYANGGCPNTQLVTVVVNPTVKLYSTLTPPAICDGTTFSYLDTIHTIGATVAWTRASVTGITPATGSGTNNISEVLNNSTTDPKVVHYLYTMSIDGCSNSETVNVTVNPKPFINDSALTSICDSSVFSLVPTSATPGTITYAWSRAFVSGINVLPNSGIGNPNERLLNETNADVTAAYVYTVTANGCSNTQTIRVTVHPQPLLNSLLTGMVCSGVHYFYLPTSTVIPALTYTWTRASVTGITPATGTGVDSISETLTNSTTSNKVVPYVFTLKLAEQPTCTSVQTVNVTVEPAAIAATITTMPPSTLCSGALYMNFGTATVPPAGATYHWSATNATVLATGNTGQYAIVNFDQPGTSVVTVSSSLTNGCLAGNTYTVNVGSATSALPSVIFTNSHFVCLQNDVTSYQWGYDDKYTLDSTLIPGAIDQSYFLDAPLFGNRNYWVMTKASDNGCLKKAYYNAPTGVTDINTGADMKLFPNPATSDLNVEISTPVTGQITLEVVNMLGQKLNTVQTQEHKTAINVAALPAGYYMVDCYINGLKIGAAKFIKN